MTSAAPPSSLPRSKSSAVASTVNPAPATATITPAEAAAHSQQGAHVSNVADNPDFVHPDHVIPSRDYEGIEDLIIVCCHAIFLPDAESPDFPLHSPHYEPNWLLAPFQKSDRETGKPGEHETFLAHVKAGLDGLCSLRPISSLLILSGAATKMSQTPISEARSYYHAALAEELAEGHIHDGRARRMFAEGYVLLEEQATDSFQNLLFSILLFRRTTGRYPRQVRVVTHAFKAKRFIEMHAPTIQWPNERIQVQGIDPIMSSVELKNTLHGEEQYGLKLWKLDPLGISNVLSEKRRQRGWNSNTALQLGEGLEVSVRRLLIGKMPEQLPWAIAEDTKATETITKPTV